MISRLRFLRTVWRLGPAAVADVAAYRLACRSGCYRYFMPVQRWNGGGEFFTPSPAPSPELPQKSRRALLERANALLDGELEFYSNVRKRVGSPPDWFLDSFSGSRLAAEGHWSTIDEFSSGDVKNVWEASRLEWVPLLARAWRLENDDRYLTALNGWLLDWIRRNPVNSGLNWKCGQEAAVRVINLLLGARLLGTHRQATPALACLVALHCGRILPTIGYAVAQNNNHGTSEAAALFIGGAWLVAQTDDRHLRKRAVRWRDAGRRRLEERVVKLVAEDGGFSQYSTNYHRVLLDTLCQAELWRRELKEPAFGEEYEARCRRAVDWLAAVTDADSGDAPNLGANDGARLYALSSAPYRDFRPTVQLASLLFRGTPAYGNGTWDEPVIWLGMEPTAQAVSPTVLSVIHRDSGDLILCGDGSRVLVRYARFRFRPSHADCLHLDLWHKGCNILRDGGTHSYNIEPRWLDYFSGTASHNTVQFDGRDQMPRQGRFLFAEWLKMDECSEIQSERNRLSWTGAYTDWKKARHRRSVSVVGKVWRVRDEIGGFQEKAVLRWRLMPVAWQLEGNRCESSLASISVSTLAPVRRLELATGWESLHYQEKTELPVLELEVGPGHWIIETEIALKD